MGPFSLMLFCWIIELGGGPRLGRGVRDVVFEGAMLVPVDIGGPDLGEFIDGPIGRLGFSGGIPAEPGPG